MKKALLLLAVVASFHTQAQTSSHTKRATAATGTTESTTKAPCYVTFQAHGSWPENHKNYRIFKNGQYTNKDIMMHIDNYGRYSWTTSDNEQTHDRFETRDAAAEDAIKRLYGEECSHYIKFE